MNRGIMKIKIKFLLLFVMMMGYVGTAQEVVSKTYVVLIKDMTFQPAELMVRSGDTVVWINKGIVPHNVTEETMKTWASPMLKPGESWKRVITQDVKYYCSIHVPMKGKVNVKPPK